MKRFYATIIITLIICSLCILNIPKYTLTTTLSANSSSNIEKPIELEELDKKEYNSIKKTKSGLKGLKIGKEEILNYLHNEVIKTGWSEEDYSSIVELIKRESNFKVDSTNIRTGACGLFQAHPCNKMKKYGNDYKINYKVQIKWGIEYIKSRYKTPTNALKHQIKKGWY